MKVVKSSLSSYQIYLNLISEFTLKRSPEGAILYFFLRQIKDGSYHYSAAI